jgi:hypothetical protein
VNTIDTKKERIARRMGMLGELAPYRAGWQMACDAKPRPRDHKTAQGWLDAYAMCHIFQAAAPQMAWLDMGRG